MSDCEKTMLMMPARCLPNGLQAFAFHHHSSGAENLANTRITGQFSQHGQLCLLDFMGRKELKSVEPSYDQSRVPMVSSSSRSTFMPEILSTIACFSRESGCLLRLQVHKAALQVIPKTIALLQPPGCTPARRRRCSRSP